MARAAGETNALPSTLSISGGIYSNVTLLRKTAGTFTIEHASGIATFSISSLPPELQARIGYDPAAAQVYWDRQSQQVNEARRLRDETERGKRVLVRAGSTVFDIAPLYAAIKAANDWEAQKPECSTAQPVANFAEGDHGIGRATDNARVAQEGQLVMDCKMRLKHWRTTMDELEAAADRGGSYFLKGTVSQVVSEGLLVKTADGDVFLQHAEEQRSVVDGDALNVVAFPVGRYNFSGHMVPKYDAGEVINSATYLGPVIVAGQ